MKTKFLSLILLTTILMLVTASAELTFTVNPAAITFTENDGSSSFTVANTGNETAQFTIPSTITISDGTNNLAVALDKYTFELAAGASAVVSASVNADEIENLDFGVYSKSVEIKETTSNLTKSISFTAKKSYCELGPINESITKIRSVDESGSSSSDDWTWKPQDEITLSVDIENNDDDNDRTVRVEWDIYDTDSKEFLDIGEDDTVDVDSNERETIEFTFEVPYDLERGSRYVLYIKAYDDDDGEEEICTVAGENGKSASLAAEEGIPLKIERDKNEVVVSKTDIPETLTCGSTTDIGLWIANTGRSREDKIKVSLLDSAFGTGLSREISKLDWDDKAEEVTFPITVPSDLEEYSYKLKFRIDYEYDDNDDEYGSFITEEYTIEVSGNCKASEQLGASINAMLDSEAISGKELTITGTVENTGNAKTTYLISVIDYNSWATLEGINPTALTIESGQSKDFSVNLKVNEDTTGEQSLTIIADFGEQSEEQEVSIAIEEQGATTPVTGSAITDSIRENWFIWVIVIINVVLIIAIILVARRIVTAK
jgi:P pilus assembly chaperone PapD